MLIRNDPVTVKHTTETDRDRDRDRQRQRETDRDGQRQRQTKTDRLLFEFPWLNLTNCRNK